MAEYRLRYFQCDGFFQNLAKNNVMDRLSKAGIILGLTLLGAIPATLMNIKSTHYNRHWQNKC
ncbi:MAG: hypothetical protein V4577_24335 [Bacteroidota bacterium]